MRKREIYGTVLVDHLTRRIVDMLPSRDTKEVGQWLRGFPNLLMVTRDGSTGYRGAIAEGTKGALQVSDYFHLLKNLIEAMTTHLKSVMPSGVGIPAPEGYEAGAYWSRKTKETAKQRRAREKREAREELHHKVLQLSDMGFKPREIAEKLDVKTELVYRYRRPDFSAADKRSGTRRGSGLVAPFARRICAMLDNGRTLKEIYEAISADGYTGSYAAIATYTTKERQLRQDAGGDGTIRIERTALISKLYNPDLKKVTEEEVRKVCELYPDYDQAMEITASFRSVFETGNPDALTGWLEQARSLDIPALNSFIHGVERDENAVRAAIFLSFTNGLVEGKVNKIKVTKRIMYGRCSHELLRAKTLFLERRVPVPEARKNAA